MSFMTVKIERKKKIYFEDMARSWLLYKKCAVKQSTYYNYNYLISKYLGEIFEDYTIDDFVNININKLVNELAEKLSPKTIKDIVSVLKSILRFAEEKYRYKLCIEPIAIPKAKVSDLKVLSAKEQSKLEKFCMSQTSTKYLGIIISLYTGLRVGELCALKWSNIDLRSRQIIVNQTLQRVYISKNETRIVIDSPKSLKSNRRIPMNDKVYEILKNIKDKHEKDDYLLTCSQKYIEPRNYQYTFSCVVRACKMKNYNFHILRHTFATNCIKVGMDAKSLSEILGHSNVNITLNRYVHSSDKVKKKYLQRL